MLRFIIIRLEEEILDSELFKCEISRYYYWNCVNRSSNIFFWYDLIIKYMVSVFIINNFYMNFCIILYKLRMN